MRTIYPIVTLLALITICRANPIIVSASVEKSWERCLVSVSPTHASVSCAVGYKVKDYKDRGLTITVPLFLSIQQSRRKSLFGRAVPTIEMNGKLYTATSTSQVKISGTPKDVVRFDCTFELPPAMKSSFSIVVTYQQELTNGVFYYLPLFEREKTAKNPKDFIFTAFPSGGVVLELDSKNANVLASMRTRISLTPVHKELIVIRKKSG